MAMTLSVRGGERVVAMLARVAPTVRTGLKPTMDSIGFDLAGYVVADKLSGQLLNRRTGDLSRSINARTRESETELSAVVGSALPGAKYPAAHEYGFAGTVNVPAHERLQTTAWGQPIAPRMVMVRAHPMRMNVTEKRYLRGSLEEKAPQGVQRIRTAMTELLKRAQG